MDLNGTLAAIGIVLHPLFGSCQLQMSAMQGRFWDTVGVHRRNRHTGLAPPPLHTLLALTTHWVAVNGGPATSRIVHKGGERGKWAVGAACPCTDGQPRLSARPGEGGLGSRVEGRARRVGGAARGVRGTTPATRQRSRGRPGRSAPVSLAPRIQTASSRSSSPWSRLRIPSATRFLSSLPNFGFPQEPPLVEAQWG